MGIFNLFDDKFSKYIEKYNKTENAVLLDVRTKEEYKDGHIKGSINIPLSDISTIDIEKDKTLYVYCHSGMRSANACRILQDIGYNAINIGGICLYKGELER